MRNKRQRNIEIVSRQNVISSSSPNYLSIKGNWNSQHFKNDKPIVLELGCGKGEFTVGLSQQYPGKNYIGVDVKGDRIWVGSKLLIEKGITNGAFLLANITKLNLFFSAGEVDEIWIVFPDPQPKKRNEKKRLTNNFFLSEYKSIIKEGGWIHLKTDDDDLFAYSMETIGKRSDIKELSCFHDFYNSSISNDHFSIKTKYENMFAEKGRTIKYLKFCF